MAHQTRFRLEVAGKDDLMHRLDLEEEGYSGDVTDLQPSKKAIEIFGGEQGREDLTAPHFPTWVQFTVFDNVGAASDGVLQAIFGREYGDFRASYYRYADGGTPDLEWRGIVQNDFYEDQPYLPAGQVRLEAHDGLSLLQQERFAPDGSSALISLKDAACRCLAPLGADLPLNIVQAWQPHLESSAHPPGRQPWEYLLTPYENWYRDREEDVPSDPMSRYDVLLALCRRFNATIRMSGGAWWIIQRDALGGEVVRRHRYNVDTRGLTANGLVDLRASLEGRGVIQDIRAFDQHAVSVAVETEYDAADNFVESPSFEDGLGSWQVEAPNEAVAERITYDDSALSIESTQEDTWVVHLDAPGTETTSVPALEQTLPARILPRAATTFLNVSWDVALGEVGPDGLGTRPWVQVEVDGFYLEAARVRVQQDAKAAEDGKLYVEPIEPGGQGVVIPEGQVCPIIEANEQVGEIELSAPARAGDTAVEGRIPNRLELGDLNVYLQYWRWATTEAHVQGSEALQSAPGAARQLTAQSISVPLRTPGGQVVTGQPRIRFSIAYTLSTLNELWVDQVGMRLESEERTLNTYTTQALVPGLGRSLSTAHRFGDGVTDSDRARIAARRADGRRVDLTSDWSASGNSETGLTLDQLHARQGLRERRRTGGAPGQARRNVLLPQKKGGALSLHQTPEYVGGAYTIAYYRLDPGGYEQELQLQPLVDGGASGVTYAFSQPDEDSRSAGGRGSAPERALVGAGAARHEAASHFVGRPLAGATLMSWVAGHDYTVVDVALRAETPPAGDFDVEVDVGGVSYVLTLPAGAQEAARDVGEELAAGSLLRVTADSARDDDVADISLTFDLSV